MISFENTLPVKIDSKKYNDFELLRNDVNELVLKDYNGFPASDPILFFRQIVEQMVEDVENLRNLLQTPRSFTYHRKSVRCSSEDGPHPYFQSNQNLWYSTTSQQTVCPNQAFTRSNVI